MVLATHLRPRDAQKAVRQNPATQIPPKQAAARRLSREAGAGRYPIETPARISPNNACGVTPAIALKSAIKCA